MKGRRHSGMKVTSYTERRHVEDLMLKACDNNVYAVDSEMMGMGYAYDDGHIAIVCPNGYVKMPIDNMRIMISELFAIIDDVEDLKRMGAQV